MACFSSCCCDFLFPLPFAMTWIDTSQRYSNTMPCFHAMSTVALSTRSHLRVLPIYNIEYVIRTDIPTNGSVYRINSSPSHCWFTDFLHIHCAVFRSRSTIPCCRNLWTKNEVINHSYPLIHLWKACLNPLVLRGGDWSDSLSPSCRNPPAPFLRWDDAAPHIARLGDIHHTGTLFCYVVTSKMMWHFRLLRVGEIWFWFSLFTMNEDSSLTCW